LDEARGDFYAFLDADDLWVSNKLQIQVAAFERDPALDAVYGHVQQFYSPELDERSRRGIYCAPEPIPGFVAGAMLIRREAFWRVGPYHTSWLAGELMDWHMRAVEAGLNMLMLPDVVLERRLHSTNKGIRMRGNMIEHVRILKASLDRRRAMQQESSEA
jgi:GT2 family glycosyltransferase